MARQVFLLLLLLPALSTPTTNTKTPAPPPDANLPLNIEKVAASLVVNQRAILRILSEGRQTFPSNGSVTDQESQVILRKEVAALQQGQASLREDMANLRGELVKLQEHLAIPSEDSAIPSEDSAIPSEDPVIPSEDPAIPSKDPAIPSEDPAIPKNGIHKVCDLEGEYEVSDDDCSISVCYHGAVQPYQGSSAPNVSVPLLVAKDCIILVETPKIWDEARTNCVALGGDLFVAGDFHGLGEHFRSSGPGPWVGVRSRTWLDGRAVAVEEWVNGMPGGRPEYCGWLERSAGKIFEAGCGDYEFWSICQLGLSFSHDNTT